MENTNKLIEQEAPEKNGDKAFVQVGADGKPVIPEKENPNHAEENASPKQGTLADR